MHHQERENTLKVTFSQEVFATYVTEKVSKFKMLFRQYT